MRLFRNLPLGGKLLVLVGAMVLGLLTMAGFAGDHMRSQMLADREQQLRTTTESAYSLAADLEANEQAGRLSREEAQRRFLDVAGKLTYDHGNGYIFVYTMDGVALSTPDPTLIGTNCLDRLVNGVPVIRLLRDGLIGREENTLTYSFNRPGQRTASRKLSYVRHFAPWNMMIGTGVYLDDMDRDFAFFVRRVGGSIAALLLGASVLGWLIARSISRPVRQIAAHMDGLVQGVLDRPVPGVDRRDEIGLMARGVEVLQTNAARVRHLEAEQAELNTRAAEERRTITERVAAEFEASVASVVSGVKTTTDQMRAAAHVLAETAEHTTRESATVASAGRQSSADVQTVASAAEELSASVSEITGRMAQSSAMMEKASAEMGATEQSVKHLAESANRIGEIVALINGIATQTNLLALNATIEAARAGEAGKGFAVVASEVKALAGQTARATEEIRVQIEGIQDATGRTITAIEGIGATVAGLREVASGISASVEQQGEATREIANSVQLVAQGTRSVSETIGRVSGMAGETGTAARQVLGSANVLSEQTAQLEHHANEFLKVIRAA
jgi:methyl-accepting chemotaxis protein